MAFVEAMAIEVSRATVPERPILQDCRSRVLTYDEAMERFGSDKPDLRFGMELVDLAPALIGPTARRLGLPASSIEALAAGGRVKAIVAPGHGRHHPARDRRADRARAAVRGEGPRLPRARGQAGEIKSPIAKFLVRRHAARASSSGPGRARATSSSSSPTRRRSPRTSSGASASSSASGSAWPTRTSSPYVWVHRFPMYQWDDRERPLGRDPQPVQRRPARGRAAARHGVRRSGDARRPRTRPAGPGRSSTTSRSTAGSSAAARSGSIAATCSSAASCSRASRSRACARSSARSSTRSTTARRPTAGSPSASTAGRRCFAHQTNIREVMAFPKTQSGTDLMLEAPSPPGAGAVRGARPAVRGAARPASRDRRRGGRPRASSGRWTRSPGASPRLASRRSSARCASRSRAIFYLLRRGLALDRHGLPRLFGLPLLAARRARRAAPPRPAAARGRVRLAVDRRHLLRRRPAVLAPRHRGRRGGAGDRPRQPPGHHRRRSSRGCCFGERPSRATLLALPVVLVGVVLISGVVGEGAYGADPPLGVVLGLATAVCYAGYLLIIRRGGRDPRRPAGPVAIATSSWRIVRSARRGARRRRPRPHAAAGRACSGWPCSGSPRSRSATCCISISLPRLPAVITSVILLAQPVMTIGLAIVLLGETPSATQLARRRPWSSAGSRRPRCRWPGCATGCSGSGPRRPRADSDGRLRLGQARPPRRRRRPTRACGRPADRADPRTAAGRPGPSRRRGRRPGRRPRRSGSGATATRSSMT